MNGKRVRRWLCEYGRTEGDSAVTIQSTVELWWGMTSFKAAIPAAGSGRATTQILLLYDTLSWTELR